MTIQEEKHHLILIMENDPVLNEDALACVEYVAQALK
jgi:hypothetical protein